ncbi:MAG: amino acid ABC transporter substrate-binding protein [Betaproteobacteria bacterium HGW-Betaproteobacteria-13]|jgi:glutamate/aspartate transport system substrate-binding protein|uniref:Amino acid ABC transporter substrate-binding protein n=1 Tax=Parazoarcus communis TaxID=41977 RepID=A0A2U8GXK0_9RHOO|nr:transporter substrate-binding domain-containing protein [Parazoarcus communis]AWI78437.1 amino acid ABC transporter substrate-binding protein [Parazoarcus communis]PKO60113.1 MAG: amino acid ABC transporter substrate-binding protein [Betaproteobacteria bacterium HGW-Betaproteobacteria-19]PKO80037.1 MAG: amino acid ABC transporter substrate-binding protein [Betaproteobacteria bacterium HGW-Betaproteobacteria-13]
MNRFFRLALLLGPLLVATASLAAPGTLDRIQAEGVIHLGYRASSAPFSYLDANGKVQGYSHEFALRIVEAVRRHLGLKKIEIRLVPITSQNRFLLVDSGRIDLECGSTTHNRDRERLATFSNTLFIAGTRLLTRSNSKINDFDDLGGQRVVTTAGTTSDQLLYRLNAERETAMTILSARDHDDAFATLEAGRASAYMMDDALLYGARAKAARPADWHVTGKPKSFEAYACMLKKGDLAFKRVVDEAIIASMRSGEAERLYAQWFTQPIPAHGLNLEFPLSDAMRALFRNPNDEPLE